MRLRAINDIRQLIIWEAGRKTEATHSRIALYHGINTLIRSQGVTVWFKCGIDSYKRKLVNAYASLTITLPNIGPMSFV